jgi:hypothetical protein
VNSSRLVIRRVCTVVCCFIELFPTSTSYLTFFKTLTIMAHSDQFLAIWTAAKKRYAEVTGEDMDATPFPHPSSLQDLQASLERQNNQFEEFRGKRAKLFKVLSGICYPIELLNNLAAGGAATVFPPSSMCFGAIMCLINAARGVSTYYDAIIDLMGTLKACSSSLPPYEVSHLCYEARLQRWPAMPF